MRSMRIAALSLSLVIATACSEKTPDASSTASNDTSSTAAAPAVAPATMTVHAKNYTYDIPDTIVGGVVTINLINDGPPPEAHHLNIVRVLGDYTSKDFAAEMKTGAWPAWAKAMGGPNVSTVEGQPSVATVELKPGRYIALCFVPGADLVPHVMKGMMKDFVVKAADAAAPVATMPNADITIKLADYNFEVTPALTAGNHAIRVENSAAQDHEVVMVKLDAGKTPDDVLKFVETMKGPPPGQFVGGVSGMSNGAVNVFNVNLTPGDYALICFIPDAKDGKPHAVHGMKQLIKVS
jgi:hypothetical protein